MLNKKYILGKLRALKIHILSFFPKSLAQYYYNQAFGYSIDWENPRDLNEWINVLMHTTDISLWTKLADKYRVREYLEEKGLSDLLVPLYGKWDKASEIDIESLPQRFVLKANNGNESVLLYSKNEPQPFMEIANKWLKKGFGRIQCEIHYSKIKPCIIAEKFLDNTKQDIESTSLIDYKIWCINGEPKYIMTMHNRNRKTVAVNLYDTDWNCHNEYIKYDSHFIYTSDIPRPKQLSEMLDISKKLSEGFPQMRVDLYVVDSKVYFGELTLSSSGGRMKYFTHDFLRMMGTLISCQQSE